jgi:predicted nucleic acid-binding protein
VSEHLGLVRTFLQREIVGLDTAPLIYFIEENPEYLNAIRPFFIAVDRGDFRLVTSIIILLEELVHPFRHGNTMLAQQYREILLNASHIATIPLSCAIAEEAARLRAEYNIRTPDAISDSNSNPGMCFVLYDQRFSSTDYTGVAGAGAG